MTLTRDIIPLRGDAPGDTAELTVFRLGPHDGAPKIHLQAALHADETPGILLLHHLLPLLNAADERGALRARFTIMPMVNPLGLRNHLLRYHIGRYDPMTGVNHNRLWPDLFAAVRTSVAGRLSDDADVNVRVIRSAVIQWVESQQPRDGAEELRLAVLRETYDADLILDLHCDSDSLVYIYTSPELMPELQDLADWIGAAATLTTADSGGGSFDEMYPLLYRRTAAANPTVPLPLATATATLEYRGQADTFDSLAEDDARRLFGFFVSRGLIEGDPGPPPAPAPPATPFEGTEVVRAPAAGLLAYRVELGEHVLKDQPIADLIALDGPDAFVSRTPILAGTNGVVLTRSRQKYVTRGTHIAKIVGRTPLPSRQGYLLED